MNRLNVLLPAFAFACFLLTACGGGEAPATETAAADTEASAEAPEATETAEKHEAHPPADAGISHDSWDGLMQEYVKDGVVNYMGIRKDKRFMEYLNLLKSNHPDETWSDKQVMAYWINAYNAFTIRLILENYPIESIMKIDDGKAWDREFIEIGDKTYSLNQIEHGILRTDFQEPRIHFAVVCASFSCPPLRSQAFDAERLDAQLEEQARNFVNDTRRNTLGDKQPKVSALFDWYKDDFTKNGTVIDYLNQYAENKLAEGTEYGFMDYDWSLNE